MNSVGRSARVLWGSEGAKRRPSSAPKKRPAAGGERGRAVFTSDEPGEARSVLRPAAPLPGVRDPARGLPPLRREARKNGMGWRTIRVLYETAGLFRRPTRSGRDDQGQRRRTGWGLEDGQGVGQTVDARATAPGGLPNAAGDRHRRGVDPQGAYLVQCNLDNGHTTDKLDSWPPND